MHRRTALSDGGWDKVRKCSHVLWPDVTPVKGVGNVPFGLEYGAVRGVSVPDALQDAGKAGAKLYCVWSCIRVGGFIHRGGDAIRWFG